MIRQILVISIISISFLSYSQNSSSNTQNDSTSFLSAFQRGKINGQIRYFFMATDNQKGLSDYYANAFGGRISYQTAKFKGFQLGITQSFDFNIASSDFSKKDSLTNASDRYEVALFDVTDVSNKFNLTRLDELYISYSIKKLNIKLGRQNLNTPFLNTQDGRMMTTAFGGIWLESFLKQWKISGGWLLSVSPRGTSKWYTIEQSLGLFSNGVNVDGTPAKYVNNITSKGVGVLQVNRKIGTRLNIECSDFIVENVFNTSFAQIDYVGPKKWFTSVQYIHQNTLNNGGNKNQSLTYVEKNGQSNSIGFRLGTKFKQFTLSFNYNYITKDGRFLLPREWGREPLFTFIPRERSEGLGNTQAFVLKTEFLNKQKNFGLKLFTGAVLTPDIKDTRFNKYGLSRYWHTNLELKLSPQKHLRNMELMLLVASKVSIGETYNNPKNIINKVNLFNYNLVLNYNF